VSAANVAQPWVGVRHGIGRGNGEPPDRRFAETESSRSMLQPHWAEAGEPTPGVIAYLTSAASEKVLTPLARFLEERHQSAQQVGRFALSLGHRFGKPERVGASHELVHHSHHGGGILVADKQGTFRIHPEDKWSVA
jgi:hypothetical protein